MVCPRCSAPVAGEPQRCPRCQAMLAPLSSAIPYSVGSAGVPITRFSPTDYGPPVPPAPFSEMEHRDPPDAERIPLHAPGYRPVVLPPPPSTPTHSAGWRVVLALLGVLALATLAGALVAHTTSYQLGLGPFQLGRAPAPSSQSASVPANTPSIAPENICMAQVTPQPGSPPLAHAQLTTGLRDSAAHDYRPIDRATTFHPGQQAYISFEVVTRTPGTVSVTFCFAGGTSSSGSVAIPQNASGRYGEFSTRIPLGDAGDAAVLLQWNGELIARLPFTVTP